MHYLDLTQARAVYQILADGRYIWASTAEYTYVEILVCLVSLSVPLARFLPITFGDGTGLDPKGTEFEGIPRNSGGI